MAVYGVEPKSRHTSRFVALPYQIMAENPAMLVEIGHCEEPKNRHRFSPWLIFNNTGGI
jgi:hypothetical protein